MRAGSLPPGWSYTRRIRLLQNGGWFMLALERFVMSDQDIQKLESQFPAVSGAAFAAAREQALAAGQSVLESKQGFIYEVFPDGQRRQVKAIEPPTQIAPGYKVALR